MGQRQRQKPEKASSTTPSKLRGSSFLDLSLPMGSPSSFCFVRSISKRDQNNNWQSSEVRHILDHIAKVTEDEGSPVILG